MSISDFPGNSQNSRNVPTTPPEGSSETSKPTKLQVVVEGKVTRKKKSLGSQFKEIFVQDGGSFVEDLITDMVIPTIREMFYTAIRQSADGFVKGVESRLFPGGRTQTTRTSGHTPYNRFSSSTVVGNARREMPVSRPQPRIRRSNAVADILLDSREDCDTVIMELDGKIEHYGHCTVGDLYDVVGETSTSTDEEWGWYDLTDARSMAVNGQFRLVMPRPKPISNGR